MAVLKLIFIFIIGYFIKDVMLYNPLLTYTIRFKKITFHGNITGNYSIDQYKENQVLKGNFTVHSKFLTDKVTAVFYRCDSEGINCEYFQTWTLTDICPKLKDKNQIWSRWYGSYDPPMVCPIDKVNYRLINATFDLDHLIRWYPDITNYQWKVTQKMYAGDVYIGSFGLQFSIFSYRKILKPLFKL